MNKSVSSAGAARRALSPRTRRIAVALGNRIVPPGGDIPLNFDDTPAMDLLEKYLIELGPSSAGLKILFAVFDFLPFMFIGRLSRFVNLSVEDQDRYLIDWQESRIYYRRMVVVLLKTMMGMGYYNDPQVLKAIGFYEKCKDKGSELKY